MIYFFFLLLNIHLFHPRMNIHQIFCAMLPIFVLSFHRFSSIFLSLQKIIDSHVDNEEFHQTVKICKHNKVTVYLVILILMLVTLATFDRKFSKGKKK